MEEEQFRIALLISQGQSKPKRRPTISKEFDFIGVKYPGKINTASKEDILSVTDHIDQKSMDEGIEEEIEINELNLKLEVAEDSDEENTFLKQKDLSSSSVREDVTNSLQVSTSKSNLLSRSLSKSASKSFKDAEPALKRQSSLTPTVTDAGDKKDPSFVKKGRRRRSSASLIDFSKTPQLQISSK